MFFQVSAALLHAISLLVQFGPHVAVVTLHAQDLTLEPLVQLTPAHVAQGHERARHLLASQREDLGRRCMLHVGCEEVRMVTQPPAFQ